jgi:predicted porin
MFNLGEFSMKKTLVALAALASMSAFAQSSVTLYGIGDVWFGQTSAGVGAAKLSQTVINSGGLNGSRFGLRGTEDLGGGLSANFQFENGFSLDSGATSTTNAGVITNRAIAAPATSAAIFARQAYIGLNGGFGNVRLGRQYSSYDELRGGTDTLGHTSFSATAGSGAWDTVGNNYTFRVNNMVRYETPNMGGLVANISYGLGENKTAAAGADKLTAFKVQYANGPIMAGIAYQNEKTAATSLKHTLVAGSYDLGVAKINAGYNTSSLRLGGKDTEMQLGVTVPMGAVSVALGYGNSKVKTAGLTTAKGSSLGLQAIYSLSKRTSAYVGLVNTSVKNGAGVTTNKLSTTAVGLRHTF